MRVTLFKDENIQEKKTKVDSPSKKIILLVAYKIFRTSLSEIMNPFYNNSSNNMRFFEFAITELVWCIRHIHIPFLNLDTHDLCLALHANSRIHYEQYLVHQE
ncbi:MAG: hypothetical protein WBP64_20905 [Nitrososphaeraceae archaeon]